MKKIIISFTAIVAMNLTVSAQFWNTTEPSKLSGSINALESEESVPVFSKDSSILYFVRTYGGENKGDDLDQDIWYSKKESTNTYSDCKPLTALNNKFNNAVLGINKTGTAMYVFNSYEGKKDMVKGIAKSEYKDGKWTTPEKLEIPGLDIDGDFYGFHMSEDETVLIISYTGPGSLGQEDLYVSTRSGSTWSTPMHMGTSINTSGFEISPFLASTNDTLFFSSNGHGGQGDADIFYSVKKGSWTSWSTPVNLGSKINSPKFDAYFIHNGTQAYWSTNREGELSDIWMLDILTPPAVSIACTATDASGFGKSDGKVTASTEAGVGPYAYLWSNGATTKDLMGVVAGEYTVTVTDAIGQTSSSTCTVGQPKVPQELAMKHYFGYNANKLTAGEGELKTFLSSLENQLSTGRAKVIVEVYSSASFVRTQTFGTNEKLAQSRADEIKKVVLDYFAQKGMKEKVTVEIVSVQVQGPKYEGDFDNQEKYGKFQYIELKTK